MQITVYKMSWKLAQTKSRHKTKQIYTLCNLLGIPRLIDLKTNQKNITLPIAILFICCLVFCGRDELWSQLVSVWLQQDLQVRFENHGVIKHRENSNLQSKLHNEYKYSNIVKTSLFGTVEWKIRSAGRYAFQLWKPLGQVFSETVKKMPTAVSICHENLVHLALFC